MRMVTHWNEFRTKVKNALEKANERMYFKLKILLLYYYYYHYHCYTTAVISVVDCSTDIEILYGLPSLFSVVSVKVPKGNWRPNRAQIRQGFLLHLQVSIM